MLLVYNNIHEMAEIYFLFTDVSGLKIWKLFGLVKVCTWQHNWPVGPKVDLFLSLPFFVVVLNFGAICMYLRKHKHCQGRKEWGNTIFNKTNTNKIGIKILGTNKKKKNESKNFKAIKNTPRETQH